MNFKQFSRIFNRNKLKTVFIHDTYLIHKSSKVFFNVNTSNSRSKLKFISPLHDKLQVEFVIQINNRNFLFILLFLFSFSADLCSVLCCSFSLVLKFKNPVELRSIKKYLKSEYLPNNYASQMSSIP